MLLLFGGFNMYFIYLSRNIGSNNVKLAYLKSLFDNSGVSI